MPASLHMEPATGERVLRFVGDRLQFQLRGDGTHPLPFGARAYLRTDLGRAAVLRREIIRRRGEARPLSLAAWRDVPMERKGESWALELTLSEVGFFKAKAYLVDEQGIQFWPDGPDLGITVHPDAYRCANTIYCAFTRLFGPTRTEVSTLNRRRETRFKLLDDQGYTVIPPSGKLRDLTRVLPHIVDTLGCRIVQLLPVNPTPTVYARFGRFGSPYAALDLTAVDPALVEFDRRTTGVEQFQELAVAVHGRQARLFLDLVINHTGWSSTLHEQHADTFLRNADGTFANPGAWGVVWEDLLDLDKNSSRLWDLAADAFLTWCRRGVDGFRCDAGYKVPLPFWQYVVARVREEFPDTLFLLEGLGGAWRDTESLLAEGGMQWAYSELFQESAGFQVAGYLDHALRQDQRAGLLVNFSETHDNDRLAAKGRAWSLLRNRLCALTSPNGAFGFTCGVEWLAAEKINVHGNPGLSWGSPNNIVPELARLNRLLSEHPCFLDGAKLQRLSPGDSSIYALVRESAAGTDRLLILVNTDALEKATLALPQINQVCPGLFDGSRADLPVDLLGQALPDCELGKDGVLRTRLSPGACYCLAPARTPAGMPGEGYRRTRAQAAWAIRALSATFDPEEIGPFDWVNLAALVENDPRAVLGAIPYLDRILVQRELVRAFESAIARQAFPAVILWTVDDVRRITPVPEAHWVLIRDAVPFRATVRSATTGWERHADSIPVRDGHVACFPPGAADGDATLAFRRHAPRSEPVSGSMRFLRGGPDPASARFLEPRAALEADVPPLVLLTNGRGAMARLCVDLGRITSKYDAVLAANLHPTLPVDRHVFVKRVRVWSNARGFLTMLNADHLAHFDPGPPAVWRFDAPAGDGDTIGVQFSVSMVPERNTTILQFLRLPGRVSATANRGNDLRLTVRVDLEDRNFHSETRRNDGAEHHFRSHTHELTQQTGFAFTPAGDRVLRVVADAGAYHPQPEWSENIAHPLEASRGLVAAGDAFSPGWFDLPLAPGHPVTLMATAELEEPRERPVSTAGAAIDATASAPDRSPALGAAADPFEQHLLAAARAFLVRRGEGKTVIAGYPWFLDWGRDTLVCARGLAAAGWLDEVAELLTTFGRFEQQGTLPNALHGTDASNRDTSDAPLWYALACEEWERRSAPAGPMGSPLHQLRVEPGGRSIAEVLHRIALAYRQGTPNGIRMDPESGLIWSPNHFTWMDTNHPACTPREGYPVEVQALWIRLLRQLDVLGVPADGEPWGRIADRALAAVESLFWVEEHGCYADCLVAPAREPASTAVPDGSLRSNYLVLVSLGLIRGARARRSVDAAVRHLVVPGGLRTLAPPNAAGVQRAASSAVQSPPRPDELYRGRYEGDEDTSRKPAYHNGTAWVWTFPTFCEALALAWDCAPAAVGAARAYLGSVDRLLATGCLGQLPEILDGDAPHRPRGCDAQAWSVTETLRVWKFLGAAGSPRPTPSE